MSAPSPTPTGAPPLRRRRVLVRAAGLGGALLLVLLAIGAAVLSLGGADKVGTELAAMEPGWLVAAVGAMVVALLMAGPRFCVLLPTSVDRPPPLTAGTLLLASTLLNMSFPGPAGELATAAAAQRTWGIPAPTALAASLHGRLSGLTASGVLALLALPFLPAAPDLRLPLLLLCALLGVAGLSLGALSLRPGWLGWLARSGPAAIAPHLPGLLGRLTARLAELMEKAADQLAAGLTPSLGQWLTALAWSVLSHLIFAGAVLCCATSVGVDLAPLVALAAHAASVVGSLALIIVPGGMGAWDLSFGGVLVASGGLALERAALVLLAVRVVQVLGMFASAAAFLAWSRRLLEPR